jgi:HPt (histidine-containing phosphotransfer) domain-containing protein
VSETDLDVAAALDAVGGDAELLAQVMQVFLQTAPPLWVNLASSDVSDDDALQLAHRLKGGAASIGALRLAACAAEIEQCIRFLQDKEWRHLQPQLQQIGERARVCVSGYLSKR